MVASLPYPPISVLSPPSIDSRGKEEKTHTHRERKGGKPKQSLSPKNFQHFTGFLGAGGTSLVDRNQTPARGLDRGEHDPLQRAYRNGEPGWLPRSRGTPRWSLLLSARGVTTPSPPGPGHEAGVGGAPGRAKGRSHRGQRMVAVSGTMVSEGSPCRKGRSWQGEGAVPAVSSC